jgi:SAM-dependent methyltransferase
VIRGGAVGFERLQLLAALRMPDTAVVLDRIGVSPGWRCADLGSGSGAFALELAARAGAGGRVEAFDLDEEKLALARDEARRRGIGTVSFEAADLSTWSRPGRYDLVYCGLVLQHLADPADLARRMWAALRPGGWLLVEDSDFAGLHCYPDNAGFAFYARTYQAVLRRRGGDPEIGRKLVRLFLATGAADPQLRLVQRAYCVGEGKTMAVRTLEAITDAVVAEEVAGPADVADAVADLRRFTADPSTVIADPRMYQVWARRPVVGTSPA